MIALLCLPQLANSGMPGSEFNVSGLIFGFPGRETALDGFPIHDQAVTFLLTHHRVVARGGDSTLWGESKAAS